MIQGDLYKHNKIMDRKLIFQKTSGVHLHFAQKHSQSIKNKGFIYSVSMEILFEGNVYAKISCIYIKYFGNESKDFFVTRYSLILRSNIKIYNDKNNN